MKEYNVLQYGAVGDGATNDAFAIQHAIDDCAKNGGGRVGCKAAMCFTATPLACDPMWTCIFKKALG